MPKKIKLLDLLVQKWPNYSREQLLSYILCGEVKSENQTLRDPKILVDSNQTISLTPKRFVSRAGYKLDAALTEWQFDVKDKVVLDVGASTGGFTDSLLQHGAKLVYSVDVARGFLDPRLCRDPRVVNLEGTNLWDIPSLDPIPQGAVVDVSFRSVDEVVPFLMEKVSEKWVLCLVKPQFEFKRFGKSMSDFDGVLDLKEARDTLENLLQHLDTKGIRTQKMMASPQKGRKGNQEFLVLFSD